MRRKTLQEGLPEFWIVIARCEQVELFGVRNIETSATSNQKFPAKRWLVIKNPDGNPCNPQGLGCPQSGRPRPNHHRAIEFHLSSSIRRIGCSARFLIASGITISGGSVSNA